MHRTGSTWPKACKAPLKSSAPPKPAAGGCGAPVWQRAVQSKPSPARTHVWPGSRGENHAVMRARCSRSASFYVRLSILTRAVKIGAP